MNTHYAPTPSLQAIFEGAKQFGLTDDEVWHTVNESLSQAGDEATVAEYLDDLSAALAQRILAKERSNLREGGASSPGSSSETDSL